MSHRKGIGWGVIQRDQRERSRPIKTREQKEKELVRAVQQNTITPRAKAKRKILMFDGDGKLKETDESKRGRDGRATSKRPRITEGQKDGRESADEFTLKARAEREGARKSTACGRVPTVPRGCKIRQNVFATIPPARPRGPKGSSNQKKVRWARQLTTDADKRGSSPQGVGDARPQGDEPRQLTIMDWSSPQGVSDARPQGCGNAR